MSSGSLTCFFSISAGASVQLNYYYSYYYEADVDCNAQLLRIAQITILCVLCDMYVTRIPCSWTANSLQCHLDSWHVMRPSDIGFNSGGRITRPLIYYLGNPEIVHLYSLLYGKRTREWPALDWQMWGQVYRRRLFAQKARSQGDPGCMYVQTENSLSDGRQRGRVSAMHYSRRCSDRGN